MNNGSHEDYATKYKESQFLSKSAHIEETSFDDRTMMTEISQQKPLKATHIGFYSDNEDPSKATDT